MKTTYAATKLKEIHICQKHKVVSIGSQTQTIDIFSILSSRENRASAASNSTHTWNWKN